MKKRFIIIPVLVIILAVGGWFVYAMYVPSIAVENVLPEGAIGYCRLNHLAGDLKHYKTTKLWENLMRVDIQKILNNEKVDPKIVDDVMKTKEFLSGPAIDDILKNYIKDEVAIAFYPDEAGTVATNGWPGYLSRAYVVVRVKPQGAVLNLLASWNKGSTAEYNVTKEKYRGIEVTTVALDESRRIVFAMLKDLVVFGFKPETIHASVDMYLKTSFALSDDEDFKKVKKQLLPKAHIFGYANVQAIHKNLMSLINPWIDTQLKSAPPEQLQEMNEGIEAIKAWGFSFIPGPVSENKSILIADMDKQGFLKSYTCRPADNDSLHLIPKDALYYQSNNCFDLQDMVKKFSEVSKAQQARDPRGYDSAAMLSSMEKGLGIDFSNDILPLMGQQTGGYLADLDFQGMVPIPQGVLFIKITDAAKAQAVIEKLTRSVGPMLQTSTYKSVPIKFLSLPMKIKLTPSYCFFNDYLLIASGQDLIQKSIDSWQNSEQGLAGREVVKTLTRSMPGVPTMSAFIKSSELIQKLTMLTDAGINMYRSNETMMKAALEKERSDLVAMDGQIAQRQKDLKAVQAKIEELKTRVEIATTVDVNIPANPYEMTNYQSRQKSIQNDLEEMVRQRTEKQQKIDAAPKTSLDAEKVSFYYNEVFKPFLDGLSSHKETVLSAHSIGDAIIFHSLTLIDEPYK